MKTEKMLYAHMGPFDYDMVRMASETVSSQIQKVERPHSHYFKPCPYKEIDVYRVLEIFKVDHPCAQHVAKKALAAGQRGHKDLDRDIQDMIDTLTRWQQMRAEETAVQQ